MLKKTGSDSFLNDTLLLLRMGGADPKPLADRVSQWDVSRNGWVGLAVKSTSCSGLSPPSPPPVLGLHIPQTQSQRTQFQRQKHGQINMEYYLLVVF